MSHHSSNHLTTNTFRNSSSIATNTASITTNTASITTLNNLKPTITRLNESSTATAIFTDTDVITISLNLQNSGKPYYNVGTNGATEYISYLEIIKEIPLSTDTHSFKLGTDSGASEPIYVGTIDGGDGTYEPEATAILKFYIMPTSSTSHSSYRGTLYYGNVSAVAFSVCCVVEKF